jgi:hypothetical protein
MTVFMSSEKIVSVLGYDPVFVLQVPYNNPYIVNHFWPSIMSTQQPEEKDDEERAREEQELEDEEKYDTL